MAKRKGKNKIWKCSCGKAVLGEFLGAEPPCRIKVLGVNGQDYEIGFLYIEVFCKKCGKRNYITSPLPFPSAIENAIREKYKTFPEEPMRKYWWELSSYYRNLLLKELSETQKIILRAVISNKNDNPDEIYKMVGMPWKKVWNDLGVIMKKANKIVPRPEIPFWK